MKKANGEDIKTTKPEEEVTAYLEKLKYVLNQDNAIITIQEVRHVDSERSLKYTNKYTLAQLFPDESPKEAVRRELRTLKANEYMGTVKDLRHPRLSEFWVFGRQYNDKDVYIKIRVEIVQRNSVFVMSFHFSTGKFVNNDFPYAKGEEGK
ncbi:MAG: hypothetical protein ACLKAN_13215 [Alkaliphilus sp.]